MASLLEIRKKIGSVKNMKKITKAMQLVAASKMKFFQDHATSSREYIETLLGILKKHVTDDVESSYIQDRKDGKVAFILYTSDKGLCGSMNNNLTKGLLTSDEWNATSQEDRLLVTVGRKAKEFARINKIDVHKSFEGLKEKFQITDMMPVINSALSLWEKGDIKTVYVVVPHFVNAFTFYPKVKQLLPFSENMVDSYVADKPEEEKFQGYAYFEPSQERAFDRLYRQVIIGAFVESMYELKATEYSSRMMAMQNATDSAQKMIDEKTLVYNKIRQQRITQQISEIVNAAEAMK